MEPCDTCLTLLAVLDLGHLLPTSSKIEVFLGKNYAQKGRKFYGQLCFMFQHISVSPKSNSRCVQIIANIPGKIIPLYRTDFTI